MAKNKKHTKKRSRLFLISGLLVLIALSVLAWLLWGFKVQSNGKRYLFIKTGSAYNDVLNEIRSQKLVSSMTSFEFVSSLIKYRNNIRPGRYEIKDGMPVFQLIRNLKNGRQAPVRLVLGKLRTREELAGKIGRQFECDSLAVLKFISSNDSLRPYQVDTNLLFSAMIQNSYLIWWNTSVSNLFKRLNEQKTLFWKGERSQKAIAMGMIPEQVYIIASIVEEETNRKEDKGKIASVYINRLRKGMKLEACPSVKFALKDFGLTRILNEHLKVNSPFNTYRNYSLPPGPICTPSIESIEAVLNAPETDYLFFAANSDMKGGSVFASTYQEHVKNGKAYQLVLDSLSRVKKAKKHD